MFDAVVVIANTPSETLQVVGELSANTLRRRTPVHSEKKRHKVRHIQRPVDTQLDHKICVRAVKAEHEVLRFCVAFASCGLFLWFASYTVT